ncbi:MAG: collagen-like protein, partial [Clostridia bacterium]|nr:collagen-like protein [Clostridia bacterium]
MIAVKIKVSGVVLTAEQPVVTSGSCGTVRLEFEFDSEWNGFSKTAVFYTARGNVFVTLSDSACEFPQEALCAAGDVKVGVFGTDGEKTLTSLLCKVRVSQGTSKDAERAANYVPGIYEQLYAKLDKVENLSVTAVSGDEAAGVLKETDGVLTLSLTLPRGEQGEKGEQGDKGDKGDTGADGHSPEKGVDYLTQAEIDKFLLEYFYYWNADGEAWMPLLSGMLCFETDEDFE